MFHHTSNSFPATTLFPSYLPLFPASLHSCGLWSFLGGWDKQNSLCVTPSLMAKMPSELCLSLGGQGAAQPHPSCVHLLMKAGWGWLQITINLCSPLGKSPSAKRSQILAFSTCVLLFQQQWQCHSLGSRVSHPSQAALPSAKRAVRSQGG